MTYELRPCPICGSTDIKHYTTESRQSYRRGTVKCNKCGCSVRAEGGGRGLFKEMNLEITLENYYAVRKESNRRALELSANKWNGALKDEDTAES